MHIVRSKSSGLRLHESLHLMN